MHKKLSFLFIIAFFIFLIFSKDVYAFPEIEIPNLIKNNNYSVQDDGSINLDSFDIDESEYTEEELTMAQSIESILSYLDASLSIEANSSTIISGKKVICDDLTGELEEVSAVYSTNLLVNKVIAYALTKEGCRYSQEFRESKDIFDCSSFVRRMYQEYSGISLGSTSGDIAVTLKNYQVDMINLQPGDLLWKPGHIGMYIGDGQIIHAANTRLGVIISSMYSERFTRAFRPIDYIRDIKGNSVTKSISL